MSLKEPESSAKTRFKGFTSRWTTPAHNNQRKPPSSNDMFWLQHVKEIHQEQICVALNLPPEAWRSRRFINNCFIIVRTTAAYCFLSSFLEAPFSVTYTMYNKWKRAISRSSLPHTIWMSCRFVVHPRGSDDLNVAKFGWTAALLEALFCDWLVHLPLFLLQY